VGSGRTRAIGSTAYVTGLSQAERDQMALRLNYDMVAPPN
jgi:Zn-dependent M28 family amino/carboxypeptidase